MKVNLFLKTPKRKWQKLISLMPLAFWKSINFEFIRISIILYFQLGHHILKYYLNINVVSSEIRNTCRNVRYILLKCSMCVHACNSRENLPFEAPFPFASLPVLNGSLYCPIYCSVFVVYIMFLMYCFVYFDWLVVVVAGIVW